MDLIAVLKVISFKEKISQYDLKETMGKVIFVTNSVSTKITGLFKVDDDKCRELY